MVTSAAATGGHAYVGAAIATSIVGVVSLVAMALAARRHVWSGVVAFGVGAAIMIYATVAELHGVHVQGRT